MEYQFAARVGPPTDAQTHCELMHWIYSSACTEKKPWIDKYMQRNKILIVVLIYIIPTTFIG